MKRFQRWGIYIVCIAALSAAGSADPETPLEFEVNNHPAEEHFSRDVQGQVLTAVGQWEGFVLEPRSESSGFLSGLTLISMDNCSNPPVIENISGDGLSCDNPTDGDVLIQVTGGTIFEPSFPYQYDWDWDGTPENDVFPCSGCPAGDAEDLSGLGAGIYTVTVTDANGCTAVASAEVTLPDSPEIDGSAFDLQCYGANDGNVEITVTGGTTDPFSGTYDFDWSNDGFGDNDDPEDLIGVAPGTYTVIVTDFLGCTDEATFTISEPPELSATVSADAVPCAGESTGTIDLSISGGTGPYQYDWDYDGTGDNDDPQDPVDLAAGIYTVTITDDNGCTTEATIEITEPSMPVDASITGFDAGCFGEATGNIDLTPSGGTGSFSFSWSNGATTEDLTNVAAGSYTVVVTDANGCTATASFTVNEPPEMTSEHTEAICAGGSVIINGTTYDEQNTSGTEVFTAANGCDSTVTVSISFEPPPTDDETYTGCSGDGYSVVVNGVTYDESNPSGTEMITTAEGCDSIVTVSLTFQNTSSGEETYTGCTGDGYSVTVNGTTYDESNPSGTETLNSANGCDSIVTVSLSFNQPTTSSITSDACTGDGFSVTVNGTVYDETNPSGVEVISNANGCDSTITIDLFFGTPSASEVNYTGCEGDGYSVVVNGTTYSESNPSGIEMATNADGCDSTITVSLNFLPPVTEEVNYSGCFGDGYSVLVNGTTYDESNPTGQEIMTGGNGCDSVVNINLSFSDMATGEENYNGCTGDGYAVVVNGTTYDESNPAGQETLTANSGCDSVVTINLVFAQPTASEINYQGCSGDGYAVTINGVTYNEANPDGVEVIQNNAGCDSTITIDLAFNDTSTNEITYSGCSGDGYAIVVNGVTYDEDNPSGTEVLPNSAGCDSTIMVNLDFQPVNTTIISYSGCVNDGYSVNVNGTTYDESNPTGTEFLTTATGCDSIVEVSLVFADEIYTLLDMAICTGGSINVGGTVFDASNPTGLIAFTASGGCDSLVEVQLSFLPVPEGYETYNGCSGDGYSVLVGGTEYNENNPTGIENLVSPEGCDSVVVVELFFGDNVVTEIDSMMCPGEFIIVNGIIYDENNQTGTETFPGQGCDSVVIITLSYTMQDTTFIEYAGCAGDGYNVTVNGTVYDENNPQGLELLPTQAGCDSLVVVDLLFDQSSEENIVYQGCIGDNYSIVVNGTTYDASNLTGTEVMMNQYGCDSIVHVSLAFGDTIITHVNYQGCTGDGYSVEVGSQVFHEGNPAGEVLFPSNTGCDSLVVVQLDFLEPAVTILNQQVCDGGSIVINGTTYDADNPQGTEVLAGAQCDSIIQISLSFIDSFSDTITYQGCMGDGYQVVIDDVTFSETFPSGEVVLTSSLGCDSAIVVALSFANCCQPVEETIQASICPGESFGFAGSMLDQPGSYSDTIPDAVGAGCDSIVTLNLVLEAKPDVDAGEGGVITCTSSEVLLTGTVSVDALFQWHGPGLDSADVSSISLEADYPGWYYLTAESNAGCRSMDSVYVDKEDNVPSIVTCEDTALDCAHDSVMLNIELSGENCMVEWDGPGLSGGMGYQTQIMATSPGVYTVQAIDTVSNCVSPVDTIMVHDLRREVEAEIGGDEMLTCNRASAMLNCYSSTTGNMIEYTWMDDKGNVLSHEMELEVHAPGNYYLHVFDEESQCTDSDSAFVYDNVNMPVAEIDDVDPLDCRNETTVIEASQSGNSTSVVYAWEGPDQAFVSTQDAPAVEVMKGGMYYLTVKDTISSCIQQDSVYVLESLDKPLIDAGEDQQLTCGQQSVEIGSGMNPQSAEFVYAWSGPGIPAGTDDQQGIVVDQAGTYLLSVLNTLNGCASQDSVYVEIIEGIESAVIEFQDLTCSGENDGMILVDQVFGGTAPYQYQLDGQQVSQEGVFQDLLPGNYHLEITDQFGCSWATDIEIANGIDLDVDLGPDLILDYGDTYQLSVDLNVPEHYIDSVVWSPAEVLSCANCLDPVLTGLGQHTVSVTVYSEFGCSATDALTLQVDESFEVYIPNVFTPNGDGRNDYFILFGDDQVRKISKMEIFNRWGDKVFSRSELKPGLSEMGWDGTFNGETLISSVYVYVFEVELQNGLKTMYKGDVTLVR